MRADSGLLVCLLALLTLCGFASGLAPQRVDFNSHVLSAVRSMPTGGGYAADRSAELRLAESGIRWLSPRLRLSPTGASPTFCSAACYMVLLRAMSSWESAHSAPVFSARVWHHLRVEPRHADGYLSWGRVNANGPGFAKWVHDLGAGVNFSSPQSARPGDFLKFFYTPAIGGQERGHCVIFLGMVEQGGESCIRFWSSNQSSGGYGVRTVPLRGLHHLIFTRITHPERIALAPQLPEHDAWLAAMLSRSFSYAEVQQKCAIIPSAK